MEFGAQILDASAVPKVLIYPRGTTGPGTDHSVTDFWVCDFGFMQSQKLLKWPEAAFRVLLADGMWWSKDESLPLSDVNHLCVISGWKISTERTGRSRFSASLRNSRG